MIGQMDKLHNSKCSQESDNFHTKEVQSTHKIRKSFSSPAELMSLQNCYQENEGATSSREYSVKCETFSDDADADNEDDGGAEQIEVNTRKTKKPKKKRHSKIQELFNQMDDSDDDNFDKENENKTTIRRRSKVGRNSWEYANLRCISSYYLCYYS